ncbi:group II truncated hemoglobin [Jannaschia aquimarina]|uniref:GlbO protein n=1 Tax=Jannaschia aquimarina TaxID=935700 RepID=A0A0D1DAU4_9RHOB|nr:group II truncated hemoglobin [Jannaschia aquimarina]KIT17063.1 globin family protein [Jannaschia aquimarina]SNS82594.1 hemoglobin [Jannaschia aquimarina]
MTAPTLYDWIGGSEALNALTSDFYDRVKADDLLGPVFAKMDAGHPAHVAAFIGEVFGGPKAYSVDHGGHPEMIRHHLGRHLTEAQRRRWMTLLLDAYEDADVPHDPEFASALVCYLEWGSRLAVINSQPGAEVDADAPMPEWGWGETGGPWQPETAKD